MVIASKQGRILKREVLWGYCEFWYLHSSYILLNAFEYHVTTSFQVPITVPLQLQWLRWILSLRLLEGSLNQDTGSFRINILLLRFAPSDSQQHWIEVWNPRSCVQYHTQKGPWQLWKLCWQSARSYILRSHSLPRIMWRGGRRERCWPSVQELLKLAAEYLPELNGGKSPLSSVHWKCPSKQL